MADNNPVRNGNNEARNEIQVNTRDRLFHAIFIKAAAVYIRVVPKWCRALLELLVLAKALILFTTLSYIHFTFSKNPMDCLEKFKDNWPRDGILQVQILKNQPKPVIKKKLDLPPYFASSWNQSLVKNMSLAETNQCGPYDQFYEERKSKFNASESYEIEMDSILIDSVIDDEFLMKRDTYFHDKAFPVKKVRYQQQPTYFPTMQQLIHFYANKQVKNYYLMEYALEYGFLRLSHDTRQKLNISMKVVTLDPKTDKCFGDSLSRFILDKLLGYDDLLMASIKRLAEKEGNRGYMKNVLTGEHYKFVTTWMGRTSYFVSFLLMFVFTISISTLLRFCHQQIFIFIVHLLHVMDWNATLMFPVAPMFTVILSLVGMEAIMAEFFNDTTTSFYVILIVWAADQFDSICCHTRLSQKFWLRFFYLYHFLFYAYHYRFNGQYSTIALAASWFFIQHSMLYFLHNYEIPAIEAALNAQGGNYLDDAVDLLVDEMQFPPIPDNMNAQPENGNAQPENSSSQPEDSSSQPVTASSQPEDGSTLLEIAISQGEYASPQTDYASPQPEYTSSQPEYTSSQSECSSSQPEPTSSQPGNINEPSGNVNTEAVMDENFHPSTVMTKSQSSTDDTPICTDAEVNCGVNCSQFEKESFDVYEGSVNEDCASTFVEIKHTAVASINVKERTPPENAYENNFSPLEEGNAFDQRDFVANRSGNARSNKQPEDTQAVLTVNLPQSDVDDTSKEEQLESKHSQKSLQSTLGEHSHDSDVTSRSFDNVSQLNSSEDESKIIHNLRNNAV